MRKSYPASLKAKIALEAVAGQRSVGELATKFEVSANLIHQWRKQLLTEAPEIFSDKRRRQAEDGESKEKQLFEEIGRLKMELDWVKKKSSSLPGS